MRRRLPEWMERENRPGVLDEDLTRYEGVPATTIRRALEDMRDRSRPIGGRPWSFKHYDVS